MVCVILVRFVICVIRKSFKQHKWILFNVEITSSCCQRDQNKVQGKWILSPAVEAAFRIWDSHLNSDYLIDILLPWLTSGSIL